MRRAFTALAALNVLVILTQFFLAAAGAFTTVPNDESFDAHRTLGYVTFLLPVLMAVLAPPAGLPRRVTGMSALTAGLVTVQVLLAKVAEALGDDGGTTTAGPLLFGLHGLNGLAILAISGTILRQATTSSRAAERARQTS
ncbi:DUF6220 domain-containing protein [Actinoplanes sp. CA-142083]|uniref:DUF6220 domain-containing protein n=1 Tax=Actinoplanes sp. CA-142083 TaxID=3239903 RepID=UPI003D940506